MMLERFGHRIVTDPGAPELVTMKDGRKFVTKCAPPRWRGGKWGGSWTRTRRLSRAAILPSAGCGAAPLRQNVEHIHHDHHTL
jgi:hypothetical protein